MDFELHLCKTIDNELVEVDLPDDAAIKLAIGNRDAFPSSGTFTVTCGGQDIVLGFNAAPTAVQAALNANPTILAEGGVDVIQLSPVMRQITYRTVGAKSSMTIDTSLLYPTCYGKVINIRTGTPTNRAVIFLKVAQSPVVYQTEWNSISSVETITASIATIGQGHKRITLSPVPTLGTWTLTTTPHVWRVWRLQTDWGTANELPASHFWNTTTTLVVPAMAQDADFQYVARSEEVISGKLFATSDFFQPHLRYVTEGVYDVIWNYEPNWRPPDEDYYPVTGNFLNPPSGYSYPFSVNPAGLKPRKGFTSTINFNSAEVEYLLAGEDNVNVSLEIEISSGAGKQTILMAECSIKNDMIDGYAYNPIELDVAAIPDAPSDGVFYGRKNGGWTPLTEIDGGTF